MRFRFIDEQKKAFPISVLCQVMEVSRSDYYAYVKKQTNPIVDKKEVLIESVKRIHRESQESYGSRRISHELQAEGHSVGRYQARSLMQKAGVQVRSKKQYQVTTDSKHSYPVAPNLVNREFQVPAPNQVWVSDITYLWTAEGWLYLAVILDLFSRRVVGWAMASHMTADLVKEALQMAINRRQPPPGLILHSDRGSQYTSDAYRTHLTKEKMVQSMSRKGNCYDNAVCERFFRSLKHECTEYQLYFTRQQARLEVIQYIEWFYNSKRLHSTLDYKSPLEFEVEYAVKAA